ncbi:MAG: HNH endonuclease signature motif containing protein [Raoultibacter sp.]
MTQENIRYRVKLRRRRMFFFYSQDPQPERYPGFKKKRTGRHAVHWEGTVDKSALAAIKANAKQDRLDLQSYDVRAVRSSRYAEAYFAVESSGWRCAYCGRRLEKYQVTVDHIIPVARAQTSWFYWPFLDKVVGAASVNDPINLVSACRTCNAHKAAKGGLWVVRGFIGRSRWVRASIFPVRVLLSICFLAGAFYVFAGAFYVLNRIGVVDWVIALLSEGINTLKGSCIRYGIHL